MWADAKIFLSSDRPAAADALANWLPAPNDQFALCVRAYVPTQPLLDGTYTLPNVERVSWERAQVH